MELGLSLGDASKSLEFPKEKDTTLNQQKQPNSKGGDLGFSLGLSTSCAVLEKAKNKSQENDEDIEDDDGDDDDDDETSGDDHGGSDDQNHGGESGAPMQLSLLPLVPVPRKVSSSSHVQSLPWSSDNGLCEGSSRDGSSGNIGRPATRGLDVNRLPVAVAEEVSSANSVGPPFGMYPNTNWLGGGSNKRDHRHLNDDVAEAERASSRASDEDENGPNARKKLRLSKDQSAFLEESFKEHSTLNPKQKHALAKQLNLRPRQVEVWFQNRRARTKLKQTEVDCEYLKRCCETLTEENRRLHKELQELRALKTTSSPFYMQLPATTLTMCPSCERVATSSTAPTPPTSISNTAIAIASTAATTAAANSTVGDTKAIPLPLTRPRFFPFPQTPTHPNQPAAS